MSGELELLKTQVAELQELVKRQTLLISKTGQNVLELQVSKQRSDVNSFGSSKQSSGSKVSNPQVESADLATNEDLVQLVGELQGQLDTIEERSIRRLANSAKVDAHEFLSPLPNADGEIPLAEGNLFPRTLKEFKAITNISLFKLAKFYELLPPSLKEQEAFEDFLEGKVQDFHIDEIPDEEVEKELKKYSADQLEDVFNDLARYLGLKQRRGTATW
ncbi:hypothetical protein HG535_0A04930 [Zygotorulaspora mrakii]|uniref:Mrp8p n=1 Tax=Zygotorulaspora mrakii TaxID=42260 RepID=A0A7H9AY94_ZYGMR|nr:uncharacterized protein HG535_0A04930 [Zygotorulaspora mrakii]QLG70552.1 hypothetical protein HG535_0A04930 [Zygotorulaspora mrakii]